LLTKETVVTPKRALAFLFAVCLSFAPAGGVRATPIPGPLSDLQAELALASAHAPGHVAVEIKDLTTGATSAINPNANMPAASTIKIPVMVEVFRQISLGKFDLNRPVTLTASDRDWGWGVLANGRIGSRYPVSKLLLLMITESDNTATNMLIRLVGRWNINHTMAGLGLANTRVGDYIRSDGDIRALRTSPSDMVSLLESMAHDQLIDPWSSREMISILSGQHHNGLLPVPLPKGLQIAHKTGTLHDTLNDVGIVYLESTPYVIAVLTTHLSDLDAGARFIQGVSKMAFATFEHFASLRSGGEGVTLDATPTGAPLKPAAPSVAPTPATFDWLTNGG
jgi:beta-lactamase class A